MDPLDDDQITQALADLPGWERSGSTIVRELEFADFAQAVTFFNSVAQLAEREDHHPDIAVHDYRHVRVILSTHSAGGITALDIQLANAIEAL